MTALEHAEELRQEAISLLLAEREAIEAQLQILGHGQEKSPGQKRRGRPPNKPAPTEEDPVQPSDRLSTTA